MYTIDCNGTSIFFDTKTLSVRIGRMGKEWNWAVAYKPKLLTKQGEIYFTDAASATHKLWQSGLGKGILSHYEDFNVNGESYPLSFETLVWAESVSGDVFFEFIPLKEDGLAIEEVHWPGFMDFTTDSENWYTLLNLEQGLMIPNNWETALKGLPFGGKLCTSDSYMPWFGQVKDRAGYIAICEHPWDAAYYADHPAKGPYTHVGFKWLPSMGHITYRRTVRYTFLSDCDYNSLCKVYRTYAKEKGLFCSLREKACKAPVQKLVGASFIHAGIKTHVMQNSDFFDPAAPEKNNHLTTFGTRAEEIRNYHDTLDIRKLYLHLDGWGDPGYDNQHPDYPPACQDAGGWEGMKSLADTLHECGYLFGIHDQYRDYYFSAKSFQKEFATLQADGTYPEHSRWAGGMQSYLCTTQAPYYVKRNFQEIFENGVDLDCAYLDVFTCNEGDECLNPRHRMTRKECFEYRGACFEYLLSKGILPSSEEVTDWSMRSLVFSHYAPYAFMLEPVGSPRKGIPLPLFNLVYHDCLIIPWMMEQMPDGEDFMLYALLNGGVPYFIRDGAYRNVDGSFSKIKELTLEEMAKRCRAVAGLHEKIAYCEMVSHEFVDGDYKKQRTVFSDGTAVEINLNDQTYQIR